MNEGAEHKNTNVGCFHAQSEVSNTRTPSLDVSVRAPSSCWVVYILDSEKGHRAQAHPKGDVFVLGACDYVEKLTTWQEACHVDERVVRRRGAGNAVSVVGN